MRYRGFTRFPRRVLTSAVAVIALSAGLLALPATGGPFAPALDTPVVEGARRGCPPTLSKGSRGDYVEYLQHLLNEHVGPPLATDGIFGEETALSVLTFQVAKDLVTDRIVGPRTWHALGAC
jgi:peptidoglycan hydrolase-like protein with peptidoglycan-binding domain